MSTKKLLLYFLRRFFPDLNARIRAPLIPRQSYRQIPGKLPRMLPQAALMYHRHDGADGLLGAHFNTTLS
jgi:hypothetical protein